jgi:HEAT repeat protein
MNIEEKVTMMIDSEARAYRVLGDVHEASSVREAAVRYLANHATPKAIQRMTLAMNDDDFGVHWEAAASLAALGMPALPTVLTALTKPDLAASPRMREGAYHVLHYSSAPEVRNYAGRLMQALKGSAGSAADISTLVEANRWLQQIEVEERRALHVESAASVVDVW